MYMCAFVLHLVEEKKLHSESRLLPCPGMLHVVFISISCSTYTYILLFLQVPELIWNLTAVPPHPHFYLTDHWVWRGCWSRPQDPASESATWWEHLRVRGGEQRGRDHSQCPTVHHPRWVLHYKNNVCTVSRKVNHSSSRLLRTWMWCHLWLSVCV